MPSSPKSAFTRRVPCAGEPSPTVVRTALAASLDDCSMAAAYVPYVCGRVGSARLWTSAALRIAALSVLAATPGTPALASAVAPSAQRTDTPTGIDAPA